MKYDTIIIGGGAAGMMAGIFAARKGVKVCIVEHMDRVGKKILSTGNGKCNITNMDMTYDKYYDLSQEDFNKVIGNFMPSDITAFFKELGLLTINKNGYIYPHSEQASTVLDFLRNELDRLGVHIYCDAKNAKITHKDIYTVSFNQTTITSNKLILACGSKCAPKTGSDGSGYTYAKQFGHKVLAVKPALVQLICKENFYKELQGVRCNSKVTLINNNKIEAEEEGELQLTGYGISGILVFQISRIIKKMLDSKEHPSISIDFAKDITHKELKTFLNDVINRYPNIELSQALSGVLNKKLAIVICKECNLKPSLKCNNVTSENITFIVSKIKDFRVIPTDTNDFDNAQVCSGGVSVQEINFDTMESKLVKGLYFAGEIIDVDGKCGGYNLTFAFASGKLAGENQ